MDLLVPHCFRSSYQRVLRCITSFGSGALVRARTPDRRFVSAAGKDGGINAV